MKIISIKYMMLFAFAMVFAACSSDGEVRHLGVTAVKALYEPEMGKPLSCKHRHRLLCILNGSRR